MTGRVAFKEWLNNPAKNFVKSCRDLVDQAHKDSNVADVFNRVIAHSYKGAANLSTHSSIDVALVAARECRSRFDNQYKLTQQSVDILERQLGQYRTRSHQLTKSLDEVRVQTGSGIVFTSI